MEGAVVERRRGESSKSGVTGVRLVAAMKSRLYSTGAEEIGHELPTESTQRQAGPAASRRPL